LDFSAPSGSGLLGEIQKGRKLKAAAARPPPEKRPPDARTGMLDEIRTKNFNLKKVEPKKEDEKPGLLLLSSELTDVVRLFSAVKAAGGLSSIMDILARRRFVQCLFAYILIVLIRMFSAIENSDDEAGSDEEDWD